ncbi:MAG: hypothetical protein OEZ34_16790 [Spirochaetia bacterium]|nr:hypothetical protein [Spirochaetia bacterium]
MKLNIKMTFKSGEVGLYEGYVQHMWHDIEGDKHKFSGYWPDEDKERLFDHARSNTFRGADDVKSYLTRFANRHGASIEIKEEGEALDYPKGEEGVKY